MQLAHQPSMWDLAEEPAPAAVAGRGRRHQRGRGAGVDQLTGWVTGSEQVLEVLLGDIGWREDRRQMYDREVARPRLRPWGGGAAAPARGAAAPRPPRPRPAPPPAAPPVARRHRAPAAPAPRRGARRAEPLLRPRAG